MAAPVFVSHFDQSSFDFYAQAVAPMFVSHFDQSSFDFYAQAVAPAAFAESG